VRTARAVSALTTALRTAWRSPLAVPQGRAGVLTLIVGSLVLIAASAQVVISWNSKLPEDAVLRAGDTVITERAFAQRVHVLEALYGIEPPSETAALGDFNRAAAKSIAVSLVLDRAASEQDIVISDKEAQDALSKIINEQLPQGRDSFLEFLQTGGVSEDDVLDEIKRQLATSRLFQQVTEDVKPVTDEDVRQSYADRAAEMVTPETRVLRNIVVTSRGEATQVLRDAQDGVPFARLAARYSLDRSTRLKGGTLGSLTASQLEDTFAKAAFDADPGSLFGPVKTRHGWNVGRVESVQPSKPLSFERVSQQLEQELNDQRRLEAWRDWLGDLIAEADVEYADDYVPNDPDAPPAEAPVGVDQ